MLSAPVVRWAREVWNSNACSDVCRAKYLRQAADFVADERHKVVGCVLAVVGHYPRALGWSMTPYRELRDYRGVALQMDEGTPKYLKKILRESYERMLEARIIGGRLGVGQSLWRWMLSISSASAKFSSTKKLVTWVKHKLLTLLSGAAAHWLLVA